MKCKKSIIILMLAVFLISMSNVCAVDVNDTLAASEDTMPIEIVQSDEIDEISVDDNEKSEDVILAADNDLDELSNSSATYSDLAGEIGFGGNVELQHDYYSFYRGSTIEISISNSVIDGNGAVIDMAGSTVQLFDVSGSGVTIKNLIIKNANLDDDSGTICFFNSGSVINCNFTNNTASGYNYGGALYFTRAGSVTDCYFANNYAMYGGAVYFAGDGSVTNCIFANNSASYGGAVYFRDTGGVVNSKFADNIASTSGGAIQFNGAGNVLNCIFADNAAAGRSGGAIHIQSGTVGNSNFTDNSAKYGGAVYFAGAGSVTDCNFANSTASSYGGAVYFSNNGEVTNCKFIESTAVNGGGAIYSNEDLGVTADTCIFKTGSDTTYQTIILSPTLNVDNFTKEYNSSEKLTFDLKTNSGMPVDNGIILISVYTNNDSWVGNYSCLSGEGWNVDLMMGDYYAIFNTEYAEFTPINRTISILVPNNSFWALNHTINDNNDSEVNLMMDYYCYLGEDFVGGIAINRKITINGNGHTIDAQGKAMVFNVQEANVTIKNLTIKNSKYRSDGGAIYFKTSGTVENCNFVGNSALFGGAIEFDGFGTVENCNFTDNSAKYGGAVYFYNQGTVTNCNFDNSDASYQGGAVYFKNPGTVSNCNFANCTASSEGGAVYFVKQGTVTSCNFTNNSAYEAGAVFFYDEGGVTNCNFTSNSAHGGSAVYFTEYGDVTNCNFINNSADGGAVYFYNQGSVTLCNFIENTGYSGDGGAIYSYRGIGVTADTCIFKTGSDTTYQTIIFSPTLNVDNFAAFYNSSEKLTFDLRTDYGMPVGNGNISISVYYKNNDSWVGNYSCLSGEEWTVDFPIGSYYAVFNTEYAEFQPVNRTIKIVPDDTFWALNHTINANDASEINLANDYYYDSDYDEDFADGIAINRKVTINGNGYTINASGKARAFNVQAGDVTIKNMTVKNAYNGGHGGAIYFKRSGNVINCNFINDTSRYSWGGAIYFHDGSYGNVINCNFTNNTVTLYGGAIYFKGTGDAVNCSFTDNNAAYGGAIYIGLDGGAINCSFTNNQVNLGQGGAIWAQSGYVTNCNFTDNQASGDGGAVYFNSNGAVKNSNFVNNTAYDRGVANLGSGTVENCRFTDNTAAMGSAIYFRQYFSSDTLTITNSILLNNRANAEALQVSENETNIEITFTGQNNLLNAIYSAADEISFKNVTYWGANGIANTGNSITTLSRSNVEAGQNITVIIIVNDIDVLNVTKVTDENGAIVLDKVAGNYTVTARHDADSYYTQAETTETFNIPGNETSLELDACKNTVKATITPDIVIGNITFTVENESGIVRTVETTLNDGVAEMDLTGLSIGEYNITATYAGNINYYPAKSNMAYEKVQWNSTIIIEAANITTDKAEIINITVNDAKDINVTVYVNDDPYDITDGTLTLTALDEGIYNVTVFWKGDVEYKNATNSTKFWAIKNIEYYANVTPQATNNRTVNITAISNIPNDIIEGKLLFILPNTDEISANYNADGTWWAVYAFDDYGDYNVTASYIGLDGVTVTDAAISIRAEVPINLSDVSINYGDAADIVIGVPEAINGQNITIAVNTTSKNAAVKNGRANATFTDLPAGEYVIAVDYVGDEYNSANSTTAILTVNKIDSTLTVDDVVLDYGESINVTVVADGAVGIAAKIDGDDAVVDGFTIMIPVLDAGNYTLSVTTVVDNNHNPVTETANITVNKVDSTLTVDDVVLDYGESINVTVVADGVVGIAAKINDIDAVVDGFTIVIPVLDAGNYTLAVTTVPDENHLAVNKTATITVNKVDSTLTVDDVVLDYGESINVTVVADGAVGIAAKINDFDAVVDGFTIVIPVLDAGNYTLAVTSVPDENHLAVNQTATITVNKLKSDMVVIINDDGDVVATLTNAEGKALTSAKVIVTLDGVDYALKTNSKGQAKVSTENLTSGYYNVTASYKGNSKYGSSSATAEIFVKKSAVLTAPDVSVVYEDESGEFVATLTNDEGKALTGANVIVTLDGVGYALKTNSKGQVKVSTANLTIGTHTASVSYKGNAKYYSAAAIATVVVTKKDAVISVDYDSAAYEVLATLTNAEGKALTGANVVVSIDGVDYALKTNSKGQAKVSAENLTSGYYNVTVSYKGNSKYNPANETVEIFVKKSAFISAPDISVEFEDESGEFVATLTNAEGKALTGANVVVTLDGVDYSLKTNSKGQVKVSTANLTIGTYTASVSYNGNAKYNPATATATVVVTKKDTVISVAYDAESQEVIATLISGQGKELVTANVVISIDGVDYSLKTNSKGQAKVSTANMTSGYYNVTASYKGNSKYKSASETAEIFVKKSAVITAPDVSIEYGDESGEFVATLTNDEGKALTGANVVVTLDGVDYALKTNSKGQVKVSLANMTIGTYTATVSYKGNAKYASATATSTVEVTKKATNLSAVYDAESNQLVATLTNGEGKALNSANVVVNLDGVDYTLKTNSKGQAKLSTADLASGSYTAIVSYKGNSKYAPAVATAIVCI